MSTRPDMTVEKTEQPLGPPAPASSTGKTLLELEAEVSDLKVKWNENNAGAMGWVKKWGAVVGLLAGVVSIPKASYELYQSMVSVPHTTAMRGIPLTLAYDPVRQAIDFSFHLSIHNDGTADDTISEMWATFRPPADSQSFDVSFDSSKFQLTDKTDRISLPFTVQKGGSRDLLCEIVSPLESKTIPEKEGSWTLNVELHGQRKGSVPATTVNYIVWLSATDVAEMKTSGIRLSFVNPK
jgi:hypothetical protein